MRGRERHRGREMGRCKGRGRKEGGGGGGRSGVEGGRNCEREELMEREGWYMEGGIETGMEGRM